MWESSHQLIEINHWNICRRRCWMLSARLFEFAQKTRLVLKCVPGLGRRGLVGPKLEFDSNRHISKASRRLPVQFRQRSRLTPSIQPDTVHRISATWRRERHDGPGFLVRSHGELYQWGETRQAGDSSRLLIDWNLMFRFHLPRYTIRSKRNIRLRNFLKGSILQNFLNVYTVYRHLRIHIVIHMSIPDLLRQNIPVFVSDADLDEACHECFWFQQPHANVITDILHIIIASENRTVPSCCSELFKLPTDWDDSLYLAPFVSSGSTIACTPILSQAWKSKLPSKYTVLDHLSSWFHK